MKNKKIYAICTMCLTAIIFFTLFIMPVGALWTGSYNTILTNDPNVTGSEIGKNIEAVVYTSYSDFTIWVYPTNFPLYNYDESENRMWSVFSQVRLPRHVQFDNPTINDNNVTMPDIQGTYVNEVYATQGGVGATQVVVTPINVLNSVYNKRVQYTVAPSQGAYGEIAYYLSGASYFERKEFSNGNSIEEGFEISLPSTGAYTVDIEGVFHLTKGDIRYELPVEHFLTYIPTQYERDIISITPDYLQLQASGGVSEFDRGVFTGSIYITSYTSDAVYPTFTNYFSDNYKQTLKVSNTDIVDGYNVNSDPLLSYTYAKTDIDVGVLEITQNGFYSVDRYKAVNVNVPQTVGWSGMFDWLFDSMGAFLGFEIAPGWSLGILMTVIVGLAVAIWAIRVFMGG